MSSAPPPGDAIRASTRAAFLRAARILVPALGLPVMVATLWGELSRGNTSPLLWAQAGAFVLLTAGAWLLRSWPTLSAGLLFLLVVAESIISLALYGPLAGNGALMVTACLLSTAFFDWRSSIAATVLALSAYTAVGAAVVAGLLPPPAAGVSDLARASTWIRTGMSLSVAIAALLVVFAIVQRALERAVGHATEERARALVATREREEAFRALAASQRVASLGHLAGGLAHDLRNVLSVVLAASETLREPRRRVTPEDVATDLERAANSGIASTRRLLLLAREQRREGSCRPAEVLSGLGHMLGPVLPEEIQLEVDARPTAPVQVAEGALSQAVLNLAVNARDAMPRGGRLVLRSREDGPGAQVVVEVEDTGEGMDPATLARAFEPLFTTKPPGLGTGLGLTMVKRTAEEAGGKVELESSPGLGTRVRLVLPSAPPPGPPPAPANGAGGGPATLGGE